MNFAPMGAPPSKIPLQDLRFKFKKSCGYSWRGSDMPTVNFPNWVEPVFPHLEDEDLYDLDDEDDE